jgi:geranylgeranyl diphosphate synthase type II
MMKVETYLAACKEKVEKSLLLYLRDENMPARLKEAMDYSLKAGGKRLRPTLVFAGAEAVGGKPDEVMDIACAIEMIHTFSLIHDDLPAMDDDDLRRGKPTNHKVFGEAAAILAGDALLAEAFYLLSKTACHSDPRLMLEVVSDIASAAGARGMTGGQQIDMESAGRKLTEDELTELHMLKTGRLITVSVTSGAKYCGAPKKKMEALENYGRCIGLAFQIADDILDIEGDQNEIGKNVGSDIENEKATFPSVIGLEKSKERAKKLAEDAVLALSDFDRSADPLRGIARYVIERRK